MLQLIFGMCSKWLRRAELEFSHLLCIFLKKLFSLVLNSFVFSQLLNSLMMMDKSRPRRVVDTERHESSTNLIESDNPFLFNKRENICEIERIIVTTSMLRDVSHLLSSVRQRKVEWL